MWIRRLDSGGQVKDNLELTLILSSECGQETEQGTEDVQGKGYAPRAGMIGSGHGRISSGDEKKIPLGDSQGQIEAATAAAVAAKLLLSSD